MSEIIICGNNLICVYWEYNFDNGMKNGKN